MKKVDQLELKEKVVNKKEFKAFIEDDADLYLHDPENSNRTYLMAVIRYEKKVCFNNSFQI